MVIFVITLLLASSCYGWTQGEELSDLTNWWPIYRVMRERSVMNMHDGTAWKWPGANYYLATSGSAQVKPDIDPTWYNAGISTNGGWIKSAKYNAAGNADTTGRVYDFTEGDAQAPLIDWLPREFQAHISQWFNAGRFIVQGTETNWDGVQGGIELTLSNALVSAGLSSDGVRAANSYSNVPVINVSSTATNLTPDVSGTYELTLTNLYTKYTAGGSNAVVWFDGAPAGPDIWNVALTDGGVGWTNLLVGYDELMGDYAPDAAGYTGLITIVTGTLERLEAEFTNRWMATGDIVGLWLRDDAAALLTNSVYSGWFEPDFDGYTAEDATTNLLGPESIPAYLRSGSYSQVATWDEYCLLKQSTNKVDLIVSNTVSPECDGWYLRGFDGYYGRFYPAYSTRVDIAGSGFIIYNSTNGYIRVSSSDTAPMVGSYTNCSGLVTNPPYARAFWQIRKDSDTAYVIYRNDTNEYQVAVTGDITPNITGVYTDDEFHYGPNGSFDYNLARYPGESNYRLYETAGRSIWLAPTNGGSLNPAIGGEYVYNNDDLYTGVTVSNALYRTNRLFYVTYSSNATDIANALWFCGNSNALDEPVGVWEPVNPGLVTGELHGAVVEWSGTGDTIYVEYEPQWADLDFNSASGYAYCIQMPSVYSNTSLAGTYGGMGSYTGNTAVVEVEYFYRESTNEFGPYVAIGDATDEGAGCTAYEGPGFVYDDWPFDDIDDGALTYIASNYPSLYASNVAAMAGFVDSGWTTGADKGGHSRAFTWDAYEEQYVPDPPSPGGVTNQIWLNLYESDSRKSPGCIVAQKFGDGSAVAGSHDLPSITTVYLFTQAGYYTNTSGLTYSEGNKFPETDADFIKLPETNATYFDYLFSDITNSGDPTTYGPYDDEGMTTNFVGWTMTFDFDN